MHVPNSFNLTMAHQLALAAELVYEEPATIRHIVTQSWRFPHCAFFDVDGTQATVVADRTRTIVAFRGTDADEIEDWLTDLDFELVDGPLGGKVHAGFYDALSKVWQRVDAEVTRLSNRGSKSLWVTGHSLGAALATLAVARWRDTRRMTPYLYTFGQPRTGDRTFARNFDFELKPYAFRIVNNNDIATRIPPRRCGYRHAGTFRYFTESGELVADISWWRRFLDQIHGQIEDILEWGSDGTKDHKIVVYRERLARALAKANASRNTDKLITPRRRAA